MELSTTMSDNDKEKRKTDTENREETLICCSIFLLGVDTK